MKVYITGSVQVVNVFRTLRKVFFTPGYRIPLVAEVRKPFLVGEPGGLSKTEVVEEVSLDVCVEGRDEIRCRMLHDSRAFHLACEGQYSMPLFTLSDFSF